MSKKRLLALTLLFVMALGAQTAAACGGLFCTTTPVSQNAERIIFTDNGDGTTSAMIQINYVGSPDAFSWILPVKGDLSAENIEVPEDGMNTFSEIEQTTNPRFIPPVMPEECQILVPTSFQPTPSPSSVEVITGQVGPYDFGIVSSEDPDALINWLNDNSYQVTLEMEPLIAHYTENGFKFVAIKLTDGFSTSDIDPLKVTYQGDYPMIPLILTAVAAQDNMEILVWTFGPAQAKPSNFAAVEVDDAEITFFNFGGNNYLQLLNQKVDVYEGRAFVTEYALPTSVSSFSDPTLQEMASNNAYLTRLRTFIDPAEMIEDPMFEYDDTLPPQSNIHELSDHVWTCDWETNTGSAQAAPASPLATNIRSQIVESWGGFGRIFALSFLIVLALTLTSVYQRMRKF